MIYEVTIRPHAVIVQVDTLSGKDVAEELARRVVQRLGPLWTADEASAEVKEVGNSDGEMLAPCVLRVIPWK